MANLLRFRSVHSGRLERWLGGPARAEFLSQSNRGWYGPPIHLLDVPGSVRVGGDGDFIGPFEHGYIASFLDIVGAKLDAAARRMRPSLSTAGAGFASISDALARSSQGLGQSLTFSKTGTTGVVAATNSLWAVGAQPAAGATGSAAPGGRACVNTTAGAMSFANPASGTTHLVGADVGTSIAANVLLLYDRLFDVAKTMNSTATEAVSGAPSRYQSTTDTNADAAAGNFLFIECLTALAATAHNWTVCTYTDQSGNTGATLPSVTGNASNIINRHDMPVSSWFCPLASGDYGIKALTQMQCSAAVATGAIDFVIGHPIGFLAFPIANLVTPFDWLTNRNLAPRIFDDACLAFLELLKPTTNATTYAGVVNLLNAAP